MLPALIAIVNKKFPDTPSMTTDELSDRMVQNHEEIVLIDTRSQEEFQVSHLEGARHLNFQAPKDSIRTFLQNLLSEAPGAKLIVCYCSVGYRSAIMTNRVKEILGEQELDESTAVINLEGSIFKWANEQRRLTNSSGELTTKAHPYNYIYGWGLKKQHWKWS